MVLHYRICLCLVVSCLHCNRLFCLVVASLLYNYVIALLILPCRICSRNRYCCIVVFGYIMCWKALNFTCKTIQSETQDVTIKNIVLVHILNNIKNKYLALREFRNKTKP